MKLDSVTTVRPLTKFAIAEKLTAPPPVRTNEKAASGALAKFTGMSNVTVRVFTIERCAEPSFTCVLSTWGAAGVRSMTDIEYDGNDHENNVLLPLGVNVIAGLVCVKLA